MTARLLAVLMALLLSPTLSGDIFLIHVGDDVYKRRDFKTLAELTSQLPIGREIRIIRVHSDGTGPGPGPDDPPPTSIESQVTAITQATIPSAVERRALLGLLKLFQEAADNPAALDLGLTTAINQLDVFTGDGSGAKVWLEQVKPLANGTITKAFLKQVENGVAAAVPDQVNAANQLVLAAKGNAEAIAAVERLDLLRILEFIRMIFQLLRDLGIIGGDAVSSVYLAGRVILC